MSRKGFIIDVARGTMVTKEGHGEREMYVILDGAFEVIDAQGQRVALLAQGDPFGEIAFFIEGGRRSATVRAIENGKVLVLRRRFLRELMNSDPYAASQILYTLASVLSERLGGMVQERQLMGVADKDQTEERIDGA